MAKPTKDALNRISPLSPVFNKDAFTRLNEDSDRLFYQKDRFVNHLDSVALTTLKKIIGQLVIEDRPVILDLMAGWDSHIPDRLHPAKVVGLGLNKNELERNKDITDSIIHDLNEDPELPFSDNTFDIVLNTVSVDYMTQPFQVFDEVGRILKPGGLFLVTFSNRMFQQKAVKVWRDSSEEERVILVEEFFRTTDFFEKPAIFVSKEKPRPKDDKYAQLQIPSDPIYAVYAEKKGAGTCRHLRPLVTLNDGSSLDEKELLKRKTQIKKTLRCPYCTEKLKKWAVPNNPFAYTWDNEFMYICFNDRCPYYVRGWDFMYKEGNTGVSYRLMYNPETDCCMPIPVPTPRALKEGIID